MRYRNPQLPPPDASAQQAGEGREFLRLLLVVAALVAGVMIGFDRLSVWLAPHIPFSWESRLARSLDLDRISVAMTGARVANKPAPRIEAALQERVDRLREVLAVPPGIELRVHYLDSPVVNAAATLGGNIMVFRGLLERLEYQEELDAVLAHEIGHVTGRHMVRQLSRGVTTAVALGMIGIRSPTLSRWLIGDAQQLQQLAYSRDAEREADAVAVSAENRLYGHTGGLSRLFERFRALQREHGGLAAHVAFLQSHPLPEDRQQDALAASASRSAPLTPLPEVLRVGKRAAAGG